MMLPAPSAAPREWAAFYVAQGYAPIPVPFKSKKPVLEAWPDLRIAAEQLAEYFNGAPQNIGLLLGSASGGLIDIDLDCPEAVRLAERILPPTACLWGRRSTGAAHRAYCVTPTLPTIKFQDVEDGSDGAGAMLVEVRGDGAQTIAPGSVHPSGEPVTFVGAAWTPAVVEGATLVQRARLLAIAAVLARHWPAEGARHQAALGAAGLLLGAAVPLEDVMLVVTGAAQMAGDPEVKARRTDVLTTHDKLEVGEPVLGGGELGKALRGDGPAVVKRLRHWLGGLAAGAEPRWQRPEDRPQIDVNGLGLGEMSTAAWGAIEAANVPPKLYRYAGGLAWLTADPAGRLGVELLRLDHIRHHLAQVATFIRWTAAPNRPPVCKPAFPPLALAADLLAVPHGPLPPLLRVVRTPVFTEAGRLLTEPGYDAASGIYYAPPAGLRIPSVPEAPDAAAGAAARTLLLELFADFPFVGEADRAHAVALLLTPFLRELIAGDVPMVVVSKSTPRTGASLLVRVVGLVQDGTAPAPRTVSPHEEEQRKRLTAFLVGAPSLVLFDNLHGRLDSPALAAILTCGGWWADRLLGHTQEIRVPVRAIFCLTGNNPVLSGELASRSVLVRLDAKMADPATRTGFRHPRLDAWVLAERGPLVAAALTLGQAWLAAGRPPGPRIAYGGFQAWADVLGGVLAHAGLPGLLTNRRQLSDQADDEGRTIRAFLGAWLDTYGETRQAVRALLDLARTHGLPIASATDHGLVIRLGRLLASIEDRRYRLEDGPTVAVEREGARSNGVFWRLRRVAVDGEYGETDECCSVNACAKECDVETADADSPHSPYSPSPASGGRAPEWVTEDSPESARGVAE